MHVYLGADHNGFELKSKVIDWLASRKITFTDFGAIEYDGDDDFNDYARKVAEAVLRNNTEAGRSLSSYLALHLLWPLPKVWVLKSLSNDNQ